MKNVIILSDKNSLLLERSGLVRLCRVAEIPIYRGPLTSGT